MSNVLTKVKALIVDDVSSARKSLAAILRQLGLSNIVEARSSAEALEKLKTDTFHIIISDWDMPDMHGLELCKKIRESEQHKNTPFIMVTAASAREKVIEALSAGVSDYAVKPISLSVIADKIKNVFGGENNAKAV